LIECGPQATGGNFTDWHGVADSLVDVGYPIATVFADGSCDISKPRDTGGLVSVGTVCEQLLYEIGDPGAYYLPDVICDFTHVDVTQLDAERVRVEGAIGAGVPEQLKVSMTWADGWRLGGIWFYVGASASRRARSFGESAVARARAKLTTMKAPDFDEVLIELVGDGSHFGAYALESETREVAVKVAAKHQDKRALMLLLKELSGVGLAAPAGLAGFAGTRPKPSPVVRLFSFLRDRNTVAIELDDGIQRQAFTDSGSSLSTQSRSVAPEVPAVDSDVATVQVPLERLAWGRSGDKGNKANIGVIARKASYLPWIAATLTEACVSERLAHFMGSGAVARYYLPGISALNFLIDDVLGGGGVASLRNDPQGKTYAQILLQTPVAIPAGLLED
jgi:hypothetical protein